MKIGLSLSRCIGDIVAGNVKVEDVLLITSSTKFPTREVMVERLRDYTTTRNRDEYVAVATQLWDEGRIHQPRLINDNPDQRGIGPKSVIWMDLCPTKSSDLPAVQDAWETYRTLLTLAA
jgi:hypothetical protein